MPLPGNTSASLVDVGSVFGPSIDDVCAAYQQSIGIGNRPKNRLDNNAIFTSRRSQPFRFQRLPFCSQLRHFLFRQFIARRRTQGRQQLRRRRRRLQTGQDRQTINSPLGAYPVKPIRSRSHRLPVRVCILISMSGLAARNCCTIGTTKSMTVCSSVCARCTLEHHQIDERGHLCPVLQRNWRSAPSSAPDHIDRPVHACAVRWQPGSACSSAGLGRPFSRL